MYHIFTAHLLGLLDVKLQVSKDFANASLAWRPSQTFTSLLCSQNHYRSIVLCGRAYYPAAKQSQLITFYERVSVVSNNCLKGDSNLSHMQKKSQTHGSRIKQPSFDAKKQKQKKGLECHHAKAFIKMVNFGSDIFEPTLTSSQNFNYNNLFVGQNQKKGSLCLPHVLVNVGPSMIQLWVSFSACKTSFDENHSWLVKCIFWQWRDNRFCTLHLSTTTI